MPDPLMYQQEHFVVLETNQPERFLTVSELLEKLKSVLRNIKFSDLPVDLQSFDSVEVQAKHLIDTSCQLDLEPGQYLQWYAVRLEK